MEKMSHVKQLFARLEKDIRFSYFRVRCAGLLSVTLFWVRCAGCLCHLPADQYSHQGKTQIETVVSNFRETSLLIRYISALHQSITPMTLVSYVDMHAVNTMEMIFIIFYMLFNSSSMQNHFFLKSHACHHLYGTLHHHLSIPNPSYPFSLTNLYFSFRHS